MSKITKLQIKEMFGIKALSLDGKNVELSGANGTGKSSVIDAIKLALKNSSTREYIIKQGATEAEVLVETDTGLSILRKRSTTKADSKSIKENGNPVQSPESFLSELVTELQLNPVEFVQMDAKEQNRMILDMIDFKWDLEWIKDQFGEIVPDVDYSQNILKVLHQIQSDDGYYFLKRQDYNREMRNKKAFIEEIGETLPDNYNVEAWEKTNLADLYTQIEKKRASNNLIEKAKTIVENSENKKKGFDADLQIEINAVEKSCNQEKTSTNNRILELQAELGKLQDHLATLEEKKIEKIKLLESEHKAKVAEFEAEINQYKNDSEKKLENFDNLLEEAKTAEKMKGFIQEYKRMLGLEKDVDTLREQSEFLTAKIEHARALPGQILQNCNLPIKGLSIVDGKPLINGLPISNLSDGEKFNLCVDVAIQNPKALQILLIDGIEKLSDENRIKLYDMLKEKNVQFVSSRTTNENELTITEL